jgi:uncharacterized protein (TIGR01777 family)
MQKVLITGGTGLIGSYLSNYLTREGYKVSLLTRNKSFEGDSFYRWDIKNNYIEEGALANTEFIIHLAGAGIADRKWTAKRKKEIIDSRVESADLIFYKLKELAIKPKAFITASAIGYYGSVTSDKVFIESDPPGTDFQAKVCEIWERSSHKFAEAGIRTVQLRIGIVLTPHGGALKKMILPSKIGIGSPLGSGKQYFPWIHIKDAARAIDLSLKNKEMIGPYNLTAPHLVRYEDFSKSLAKVLKRPHIAPNVPAFVLKAMFGEMAQIILNGSPISSDKLVKAGFKFEFDNLEMALKNLLVDN